MSDDLPVCDCGYYRDVCGCPEPPPERAIRAAEAKFGVGHPRHGEAALGDLEPWQMEALAADLRHLFATGRNPQLDDLDDLCPHCGATKGVCGDAGHRERSLPLHRTEAGWPRCAPPATAAAAPTARTPLSNAELNEVLRGVTGGDRR